MNPYQKSLLTSSGRDAYLRLLSGRAQHWSSFVTWIQRLGVCNARDKLHVNLFRYEALKQDEEFGGNWRKNCGKLRKLVVF